MVVAKSGYRDARVRIVSSRAEFEDFLRNIRKPQPVTLQGSGSVIELKGSYNNSGQVTAR